MWLYFCHIQWFLYFFLTIDGTILTLYSTNITYAVLLSHSVVPLFFFLTFDGINLILCSTNITCDYTFVTFGGSLIFFSHLMVQSSHYAIPTSHVTVLLSHLVVPLFFSHIWWNHPHIVQYQHHIWLYFGTFGGSFIFFPTFDGTILILCSTNITCDSTFVTFGGSFFFSRIWWYHLHII